MRNCANFLVLKLRRSLRYGTVSLPAAVASAPATPGRAQAATLPRWLVLAGCALGVAALPGCAGYYYGDKYGPTLGSTVDSMLRSNLVEASHRATDALLKTVTLDAQQPVLVTPLVNMDQRSEPSQLGAVVAEQIAGRLVQRGVRVTALKWQEPVAVQQRHPGEQLSQRAWPEVGRAHGAQAVVVGTYAASARQVYVSLKLVLPESHAVVAAHDYVVPMDDDVRALLRAQ